MKLKELLGVTKICSDVSVHVLSKNGNIIKILDEKDKKIDEQYMNCDVIESYPAFVIPQSGVVCLNPETIEYVTRIKIDFTTADIQTAEAPKDSTKKKSTTVKELINKIIDTHFDGDTTLCITIYNSKTKNPLIATVISKDTFTPKTIKGSFQYIAISSYFSRNNVKLYSISEKKDLKRVEVYMEIDYGNDE